MLTWAPNFCRKCNRGRDQLLVASFHFAVTGILYEFFGGGCRFLSALRLEHNLAQVKSAQSLTCARCLEVTESLIHIETRWLGLGIFQYR